MLRWTRCVYHTCHTKACRQSSERNSYLWSSVSFNLFSLYCFCPLHLYIFALALSITVWQKVIFIYYNAMNFYENTLNLFFHVFFSTLILKKKKCFGSASLQSKVLIHAKSLITISYLTNSYCLYLLFHALPGKTELFIISYLVYTSVRGDRAMIEHIHRDRLYSTYFYTLLTNIITLFMMWSHIIQGIFTW